MIAPARVAAYDVLSAVSAGFADLPDALAATRTTLRDARDQALAAADRLGIQVGNRSGPGWRGGRGAGRWVVGGRGHSVLASHQTSLAAALPCGRRSKGDEEYAYVTVGYATVGCARVK